MAEDADDLLTELLNASRPVVRGCTVCDWLKARDDAAKWDSYFFNPRITTAALTSFMRARGYGYKSKPVSSHRREQHRAG